LLSSYGNRWHGDPAFAPVFAELNRRRSVVYTHASAPPCCQNLQPGINETTIEYNTDTSRTIISLIESGRASQCPNIRFIFSHAGGTMPSLAGRFLGAAASAESLARPAEQNSRLYHLRRFYYDTAGSANPVQMVSLKMIVPVPRSFSEPISHLARAPRPLSPSRSADSLQRSCAGSIARMRARFCRNTADKAAALARGQRNETIDRFQARV
jgi:hypothetical protein